MDSDQHFLVPPPPRHPYAPMDDGQFLLVGGAMEEAAVVAVGRSGERKRRFTEEQVRSLESTFHARRAKLEPREKAELARELGLQPRQVAIWFQNKRARWRSKQLEHDYAALRAKYDALHARVQSLKQEKLALASQLQELSEKLKDREDKSGSCNSQGDEKRNISCIIDVDEGVVVPAAGVSMESSYGGLPEPFCATPELWDTWPLVEWNAVA